METTLDRSCNGVCRDVWPTTVSARPCPKPEVITDITIHMTLLWHHLVSMETSLPWLGHRLQSWSPSALGCTTSTVAQSNLRLLTSLTIHMTTWPFLEYLPCGALSEDVMSFQDITRLDAIEKWLSNVSCYVTALPTEKSETVFAFPKMTTPLRFLELEKKNAPLIDMTAFSALGNLK